MSVFNSPFEKLGLNNLGKIQENTMTTALAVSPGGFLFNKVDEIVKYLKIIAKQSASTNLKDATLLKMIGGKTIKGIGQGFDLIVKALNQLPDAKEAREKMAVIVTGINALSNIGGSILKFSAALALSTPLLLIGLVGLPILTLSILTLGGAFHLINKLGVLESMEDTGKGLKQAGLGILSLAASLALFGLLLPPTGKSLATIGMAALTITVIGGAFFLLDKMGIDKSMKNVGIGLAAAGLGIASLGLGLMVFNKVFPPSAEGFASILLAGTAIVGIGFAMGLIGVFAKHIVKGSLSMIVAAIPIVLLGYALKEFTEAVPPTADGWESIGQILALVTGVGVVMGLAGVASAFIIPGAAAMLIAGGALILIAKGVKAMSGLFDGSLDKMLEDSGHETEGFLGFGGGRMMSKLEWLMLSIARSFTLPPSVLGGMYAAMPVMISSGLAMLSIAKGVEKIQRLKINYDVFPGQVSKLVNTLAIAFGEIGVKYPGGGGGILSALTGSSNGDSAVAQGVSAVMGMGRALGSIATGVQNMANLAFPIAWDKNGNPIKFKQLTEVDFVNLGNNTQLIVNALTDTFAKIGNDPAIGKGGRKGFFARVFGGGSQSPVADGVSAVMGMGEALGSIASGVQSMADLKFPIYKDGKIIGYESIGDIKDIKARLINNTQNLVLALTDVFGKIGKSPDAEDTWGWFGKSNIERGISLVEDFGNPIKNLAMVAKTFGNEGLDVDTIKSKIQTLISTFTGETGALGQDQYKGIGDMWNLMGVSFKRIGGSMPDISEAINSMDIKKLTETRQMFDALARLAENDGENTLTAFAEKLMKAVEELSGTVENLQNAVGEQSSGIKDVVGGLLNKVTDKVKEVTGATAADTNSTETSSDMSEVVELLGEIEERLNRPLRIIAE